jgi:hypothetical protein
MDNVSLSNLINKIPHLKFKYLGSFSPTFALSLDSMPPNTFQIVNTTSKPMGQHWIVIIKIYNIGYFGDSMGNKIEQYKELKIFHKKLTRILSSQVQRQPDICGFYAIYIANQMFAELPIDCSEHALFKFVNKYY